MTAIRPARLKIQAQELAGEASSPPAYLRVLHGLLDFYADRTYRPGQAGEPPPLLKAYHVPPPVLRGILGATLASFAGESKGILKLADALWSEPTFEFRLLATSLLGEVSTDPPEPVLERFTAWAKPSTERRLINALIENGLKRFRQEQGERYLDEVKSYLMAEDLFVRQLGLQCLEPLVKAQDYEDFPTITHLLVPILRSGPAALRPELLKLIQAMGGKSPNETAFFLRQNLSHGEDNLNTAWLIRHSLANFPAETQAFLRGGLRDR